MKKRKREKRNHMQTASLICPLAFFSCLKYQMDFVILFFFGFWMLPKCYAQFIDDNPFSGETPSCLFTCRLCAIQTIVIVVISSLTRKIDL